MNKNSYLNVVITVLGILVIIVGYVLITSIDLSRKQQEAMGAQLEKLNSHLEGIQQCLDMQNRHLLGMKRLLSQRPVIQMVDSNTKQSKPSYTTSENVEIANAKYYPKNSDDGGVIVSPIASETTNLNSMINNDALASAIWSRCFDSLAERDLVHTERFEPKLATSWEISDDKLVYTIHLRKGVYWQDFTDPVTKKKWKNVEVTASDYKFYVDVILNKDTQCAPMRTYLNNLDRVEVIDKYTFKVYWKKKYFKSTALTLGLQPLPRHFYYDYKGPFDGKKFNNDHARNRMIVGCGPYRFLKWDKGQRLILVRNETYFGKEYGVYPRIKRFIFEVISHENTQLQALKSKKLDEMTLSPEQWMYDSNGPEFQKDGFLRKYKYPGYVYRYIGYNEKCDLFKDKRVRRALTHLINRDKIAKDVYHGLARVITGPFFIDSPFYDKTIKPYEFSVEKGKKLLAEAGWKDSDGDGILDKNGRKFEFTILAAMGREEYKKILPMIRETMAAAGINARIKFLEWSVYLDQLREKKYEATICGWQMGPFDPDPYQLWHSSQADIPASSNHIYFKNKEADKLIEQIRVTFDVKKRLTLYHKFHKLLHEEQPYTFLVAQDSLNVINRRYQNFRLFPAGGTDFNILWVKKKDQRKISEIK